MFFMGSYLAMDSWIKKTWLAEMLILMRRSIAQTNHMYTLEIVNRNESQRPKLAKIMFVRETSRLKT